MSTTSTPSLIWVDLEMTGLDPDKNTIIEIATVVTDDHLNIVAEGPELAIHQPSSVMESMDEWNTRTHAQSGLTQRVKDSSATLESAEKETLAFLQDLIPANSSPMCGNSICQDRRFLYRWMPKLEAYFHYRNIDVSSLKELAKRWHPESLSGFSKQNRHTAKADILESIEELKHYYKHFIQLK